MEIKDLADRGMREIKFPKCLEKKEMWESEDHRGKKIHDGERLGEYLEKRPEEQQSSNLSQGTAPSQQSLCTSSVIH